MPDAAGASSLRIEADVAAGSDRAQKSWFRIVRLPGQTWTQAFSPSVATKSFALGRLVSEPTRCIQVEVTDDAWGGYVLFDRGKLQEISCFCVGVDLQHVCSRFGIPTPELDDDDLYDDAELFHSLIRPDETSGELSDLATRLGFWVDTGYAVWESTRDLERMDLLFDD